MVLVDQEVRLEDIIRILDQKVRLQDIFSFSGPIS